MVSTDPNDPSFGLETDQSSPNFGLASEPPKQESVVGNALAGAGDVIKGFAQQFVPKFDLKTLAGLAYGPVNAQIQGYNAIKSIGDTAAQVQAADETPAFSRERFGAGLNVVGQLGLLALGGREKPLSEIALGKTPEVAPEAMPQTTEPLAAEVAAKEPIIPEPNPETSLQVMPETRFQMVDEPPPEIAPARNIMESARYSPASRPGQETPLASDAFPSISQSAEEARRTARTVETGIESETARIGGDASTQEVAPPSQEAQPPTTAAIKPEEAAAPQPEQIPSEQTPALEVAQEPATTAEPLPKEAPTEVVEPTSVVSTPESAAKAEPVGISEKYREDELGSGSVIPGVGKTPAEARDWGHDFINKGGNPYDLVNKKGPKKELWQEVGGVRAEYERLGIEKRKAEASLEANPDDPLAQMAFDNADEAQRKWSKDMQPVLTRAGDALRAASRAYPSEINSFSDFTDILHDHYGGEVELTPVKRAEIQKLVKATKQVNGEANGAREQVTNEAVKRAGGKVLPFEDLKSDLRSTMEQLLKDCAV